MSGPMRLKNKTLPEQIETVQQRFEALAAAKREAIAKAEAALREATASGDAAVAEAVAAFEADDSKARDLEIAERSAARVLRKHETRLEKLRGELAALPEDCEREIEALRRGFALGAVERHSREIDAAVAGRLTELRLRATVAGEDTVTGERPSVAVAAEVERRVTEELAPMRQWLRHDAEVAALRTREHGSLRQAAEEQCRAATEAALARVKPIDARIKRDYFFARHGEATYADLLEAFKAEKARVEADEAAARAPHEQELARVLREIDSLPLSNPPKAPTSPRPSDLESWRAVLGRPSVVLPAPAVEPEPEPVLQEPEEPPARPRQWLPASEWIHRHGGA